MKNIMLYSTLVVLFALGCSEKGKDVSTTYEHTDSFQATGTYISDGSGKCRADIRFNGVATLFVSIREYPENHLNNCLEWGDYVANCNMQSLVCESQDRQFTLSTNESNISVCHRTVEPDGTVRIDTCTIFYKYQK